MARSYRSPKGYNRRSGRLGKLKRGGVKTRIAAPISVSARRAAKNVGMRPNGGVSTSLKARSYRVASGFNRRVARAKRPAGPTGKA